VTPVNKTPKRGRPRRSKKVSEARLVARCSEAELKAAEECAKIRGSSLSDFIREAVADKVQLQKDWQWLSGARSGVIR